jgi:hypothetical protein
MLLLCVGRTRANYTSSAYVWKGRPAFLRGTGLAFCVSRCIGKVAIRYGAESQPCYFATQNRFFTLSNSVVTYFIHALR